MMAFSGLQTWLAGIDWADTAPGEQLALAGSGVVTTLFGLPPPRATARRL